MQAWPACSPFRWLPKAWYLQSFGTPIELVVFVDKGERGDQSHKNILKVPAGRNRAWCDCENLEISLALDFHLDLSQGEKSTHQLWFGTEGGYCQCFDAGVSSCAKAPLWVLLGGGPPQKSEPQLVSRPGLCFCW